MKCCKDKKNGQRLGDIRTILASEFEYVEKLCISVGGRLFFHLFCFLLSFTFISEDDKARLLHGLLVPDTYYANSSHEFQCSFSA